MNPYPAVYVSDSDFHERDTPREFVETSGQELPTNDALPQAGPPQNEELLRPDQSAALRSEWDALQTMFVDDPKSAVARADELVKRVISAVEISIGLERDALEQQWVEGAEVSTEDLRLCLQRYRGFFQRLLSA